MKPYVHMVDNCPDCINLGRYYREWLTMQKLEGTSKRVRLHDELVDSDKDRIDLACMERVL